MSRSFAVLLSAALTWAGPAFAADAPGCADPAWANQRLPGFELSSCQHRDWARFSLDTTSGQKTVEGRRDTVTYTLVDESKNPANAVAWKHFVAQGKKAGATLQSNAEGGWTASLSVKSKGGDTWYVYEHGSGNEESTGSYTLTTITPAPLALEVKAKDSGLAWEPSTAPCKDPPWLVKQLSAYKRERCENRDLDQVTLELPGQQKVIAGHVSSVVYTLTDPAKDMLPVAVWKNYVAALEAIGAKLQSDPNDANRAYLMKHTKQGDLWYLYQHGSGNEESTIGFELLSITPAQELPKTCTMRIYGVNFDFDKATLRPDSEPVLEQVRALFAGNPSLKAEIGGHTDDVGDKAYNQKLSGQRAEAVKGWLTGHGIEAGRLTTAGYGDSQPVVPNSSDENRAKNRRVELKRVGCTPGK